MALNDHLDPGIYIDEVTGAIWRKPHRGPWTVDGQEWLPFPKALTTLTSVVTGPAVSVSDAVSDESRGHKAWHTLEAFPDYEMNVVREVRNRLTKVPVNLCCNKPNHAYYWLIDVNGIGSWANKAWL